MLKNWIWSQKVAASGIDRFLWYVGVPVKIKLNAVNVLQVHSSLQTCTFQSWDRVLHWPRFLSKLKEYSTGYQIYSSLIWIANWCNLLIHCLWNGLHLTGLTVHDLFRYTNICATFSMRQSDLIGCTQRWHFKLRHDWINISNNWQTWLHETIGGNYFTWQW